MYIWLLHVVGGNHKQTIIYCKLFEVEKFADGQGTSNSLENFCGLFAPVKMCSRAYAISLIECICLIIPDNYMYRLTCLFLSLAGSVAVRLHQARNHTM